MITNKVETNEQGVIQMPDKERSNIIQKVVTAGDLSGLSANEKLKYYKYQCDKFGVDPLTKPFDLLVLNRKEVLYANKNFTDQLRAIHKISIKITAREKIGNIYCVTAQATMPDGRCDESQGTVPTAIENGKWVKTDSGKNVFEKDGTFRSMSPEEEANAILKAETKAKRRVTLSICNAPMMDETEVETIPHAQKVEVPLERLENN